MTNPDYLKCPGSDPTTNATPEIFSCPECGDDIEIWTDENGAKCSSCKTYFKRVQLTNQANNQTVGRQKDNSSLDELLQYAKQSGATDAVVVSASDVHVDKKFADMCLEPRCPSYGLSKSCPPYVGGPDEMKKKLADYDHAVFFKIEVPREVIYSSDRRECYQLLHETASGVEHEAARMGCKNAQAYAGGSCKKIFCDDQAECMVASEKGKCRHPKQARPSMSGYGIEVAKLITAAGWTPDGIYNESDSSESKTIGIYGLVLIC